MFPRFILPAILLVTLTVHPSGQQAPRARTDASYQDNLSYVLTLFEQYLEALRQQAGIPGLSAAIVSKGQIIWERGFGYQDVENAVRATPSTPYLVGDLTQAFAATLMLQCREHDVDLDGPIAKYSPGVPDPTATVRHVLAHISDSPPGTSFRYDPGRFTALTPAVERCFGRPFRLKLAQAVLDRAGMFDSVPGSDLIDRDAVEPGTFSNSTHARYEAVLRRMAKPYRGGRGRPSLSSVDPAGINAAGGLVSTVRDLAEFSAALDDGVLLSEDSLELAWSNAAAPGGRLHPTGLGWFVQRYDGQHVVWHFGRITDAYSSLLLKVPDRDLTLILLANSDGLSAGFSLSAGDVTASLFAQLFLSLFV